MNAPAAEDRKCYGQLCTVARALDVIGDRWTLLLLRELLGGPARFSDLQAGLPGIARNLLTNRLRRLDRDGLVRRVKATNSTQYCLTDLGAATRPVVEALGLWGATAPKLAAAQHDRSVRSSAVALQAILGRAGDALPQDPSRVELEVDGEPLEIVVGPHPVVTARPSTDPHVRLRTTREALNDYLEGRAFDRRKFTTVSGDEAARSALLHAMSWMY